MMRVTRYGLFDLLQHHSARQMSALRDAQEQAVTGLRVNRPSDEPASLSEIHRADSSVRSQRQFQSNAGAVSSYLALVDGALAQVSDLLVRAREIAVAMAGDTVNAEGRAVAAVEVRGLQDALLDAANMDVDGRYLFSGTNWGQAAFASDGTYQGSADEPTSQVAADRWVPTGFAGSDVFQGDVDIFAVMEGLATALETNDPTAISAALGDLDLGTTQNSMWRARAGTEMNASDDALEVAGGLEVLMSARLSALVTADPAETYMRMNELQQAYEATLQVAATGTSANLFDFL